MSRMNEYNWTSPTVTPEVNVTSMSYDYPDADAIADVWFYTVGGPGTILSCTGLVCNLLSLGVLLHREMRSSPATFYLIALAVYDATFLAINAAFVSVEFFYHGVTGNEDWYDLYVAPSEPVVDAFLNVCVTGSAYTTVALSVDRSIGVTHPLSWSNVCTTARVRVVLVGVFLWACLLNLPLMMESRLEWQTSPDTNETSLAVVDTEYSKTFFHKQVYLKYIIPLFDAALPVVLIAIVSAVIGVALHRRRHACRSLFPSGRGNDQAASDAFKITLQVVCISLFTLISRALRVATFIILNEYDTIYVDQCPLYCGAISAINAFWTILNSTINFFLYCYFGNKFRRLFLQIYGCRRRCGQGEQSRNRCWHLASCCGVRSKDGSKDNVVRSVWSTSSTSMGTTTSRTSTSSVSHRNEPK